jgi:tripartite-type tricarboxylate transporter receptor subunit TctC
MQTDKELISMALSNWANHIETGDMRFTRAEVAARVESLPNKPEYREDRARFERMLTRIAGLSDDQQQLVLRLRRLAVS